MDNKAGQKSEVQEKIYQDISSSEEKRKILRFEHSLAALLHGSIQVLGNDEFVTALKVYLPEKYLENKGENRKILVSLSKAVVSPERRLRERTITILALTAARLIDQNEKGGILILVHTFCKWLEYETEILPGLPVILKRIEELTAWLIERSFWKEARRSIALLAVIQKGELQKGPAIRVLAGKTLGSLATDAVIEKLIERYFVEENDKAVCKEILRCLGTNATMHLLNKAIQTFDRDESLILIGLLSDLGPQARPVFEKYLGQNATWAILRNIIFIVSEIQDESLYDLLEQYFSHEDSRVQHEMIKCAVKLGGVRMKDRLLFGLNEVNDSLKIYMIGLLAEHGGRDESVLTALCELAEAKKQFSRESEYNILSATIHALRFFPSWRSIDLLGRLRDHYGRIPGSDHLLLEIEQSLKILAPQLRHNQQRAEDNENKVTFDSDPLQKQLAFNKAAKTEEKVKKLVREGNVEGAGQLLYDHALAAAQEKDFMTAEMLRDRVLEVNPMALTEVIELGELIEEQKTTLVSSHHIEIWSKLYDDLTIEEFNALYQVLRQEDYRKGDPIIEAGEADESLYFLNSGYISLNCIANGKEQFLKRMVPSDVLGSEQFFSASVWTVSLRALSDVQVQVLDHTAFREISGKYPELEDKLQRYCEKYSIIPELLKMSGGDRREYPRHPIPLLTKIHLRDPFGVKGSKKFNGELIDISRNGMAFAIKISSKNNAKLLLGRHIAAEVFAKNDPLISCSGVIVGVRTPALTAQTFTVHVKFSKIIDEAVLKMIISQAY